jgi:NAD-dependent deacetylase
MADRSQEASRSVARAIRGAARAVALTGAGISTAAGIADFRGPQGIYVTRAYPEDVFDIDVFLADPEGFYTFARDFLELRQRIRPTFAHEFLAQLERDGHLSGVVTQNIDGLHRLAGSREVVEVHGGFERAVCVACEDSFASREIEAEVAAGTIPRCRRCGGLVKPDIVFFGEAVKGMDRAEQLVRGCDLLLVIGSSLTVFPAAGLPALASGPIIVVTRGPVSVPFGARRVDADIETFFREVAEAMSSLGESWPRDPGARG